jgi:LacI family transcriptional regulator
MLTWPGAVGFAERMLHATLQTATRAGYLLIFMDTANDRDHQSHALATLRDHQVDALLVIAPDLIAYRPCRADVDDPDDLGQLRRSGRRSAKYRSGRARRGISGGWSRHRGRAHPYWRRCRAPEAMQNRLRLAGIQAAAEAAHVAVSVQTAPNRDIGSGFDAARTLLSAPGVPTALICTHERLAVGARLAAADLGVRHSKPTCRLSASMTVSCLPRDLFRR